MLFLPKPILQSILLQAIGIRKQMHVPLSLYSATLLRPTPTPTPTPRGFHDLCHVVSNGIGSLDDLEASLNKVSPPFTPSLVTQVLDSCKSEAPTRRLLRFFLWSVKNYHDELKDEDFNHALRVFAEKKDYTAMQILISQLGKEGKAMETRTFSLVADALVKLGREDEALGVFKNLRKLNCPQDSVAVNAIVSALCSKGHVKRAEGVIYHHKDKISEVKPCIYRNLLYGWSVVGNVKESRRIIKTMKSSGINPDLFCYNTFLKCLCKKNLKSNPSGLVPEALNVMMEMRTYKISPVSVSYNILLSCLGKTRRVKESLKVLNMMTRSGCSPDWFSYYLVTRVLFLTGRFGKGKQIIEKMFEEGKIPEHKFFYDLICILCGVERVNYALELFEFMKKSAMGGYEAVYEVLIPKICKAGDFGKGVELWNEATAMGLKLLCTSDVLDPKITEVFMPVRKAEESIGILDHVTPKGKSVVVKPPAKVKKGRKHTLHRPKKKKRTLN